ncbi:MAG: CDP-alcohol phosphatidyltransferase family protein [Gemmatimonadales bacterium]
MALNAHARPLTDRLAVPIAKGLVRLGATPNWLTIFGLVFVLVGVAMVLSGARVAGAVVIALATIVDGLDGAVARLRGTDSDFGAFLDSVADRVADAAIFGAAAWLVRGDPVLFIVAMVALAGALITSYIRAKAEALGWHATVGLVERPERMVALILAIGFGFVPLALWLLAVGGLVTVAQRMTCVTRQALRQTPPRRVRSRGWRERHPRAAGWGHQRPREWRGHRLRSQREDRSRSWRHARLRGALRERFSGGHER